MPNNLIVRIWHATYLPNGHTKLPLPLSENSRVSRRVVPAGKLSRVSTLLRPENPKNLDVPTLVRPENPVVATPPPLAQRRLASPLRPPPVESRWKTCLSYRSRARPLLRQQSDRRRVFPQFPPTTQPNPPVDQTM